MRGIVATVLVCASVVVPGGARVEGQGAAATAPRAFDVVSIKRLESADGRPRGVVLTEAGRLMAPAFNVRELVAAAYGVEPIQVSGGAGWVQRDFFSIEGRTSPGISADALRAMLRAMLAERFALSAHQERQPRPVFELVMRNADRRLGSRLRLSGPECAEPVRPQSLSVGGRSVGPPPPPPPPPPGMKSTVILNRMVLRCPAIVIPGYMSMRGVAMETFALWLQQYVERPVVDRTGLGNVDIDLAYAPPDRQDTPPDQRLVVGDGSAPELVTALQEQLGLKLEAARLPIDVVVIDAVRPPTEN